VEEAELLGDSLGNGGKKREGKVRQKTITESKKKDQVRRRCSAGKRDKLFIRGGLSH